jgi:uncharacterized protein
MDDLLTHLVKELVEKPDEIDVLVDESQTSNEVTLIIDSNPDDVPLIIGRKGRTIKALRNIISIIALKEQKRVYIQVKHQRPREEPLVQETKAKPSKAQDDIPDAPTDLPEAPKRQERIKKIPRPSTRNQEKGETEDILGF